MPNLTQRATHRVRDTAQTTLARAIQMTSQFLGRFTPGVQTRIVRGVQVCVEVHVKSGVDDVSTHAAALTYAAFLSLVPLIMLMVPLYVLFRRDGAAETPTMAPDLAASGER